MHPAGSPSGDHTLVSSASLPALENVPATPSAHQLPASGILEEALKSAVLLSVCSLCLAWLLCHASNSLLLNLPVAVALVLAVRWLALQLDPPRMRHRLSDGRGGGGSSSPSASRCTSHFRPSWSLPNTTRHSHDAGEGSDGEGEEGLLLHGALPGIAGARGGGSHNHSSSAHRTAGGTDGWRDKVHSDLVCFAWDSFCGSVVQQWVYDTWYGYLTADREFPAEVRRIMNTTFGELCRRARGVDAKSLLLRDMSELVAHSIEMHRATVAAVGGDQLTLMSGAARERALQHEMRVTGCLHAAMCTPEGHYKYLRAVAEGVMVHSLPGDPMMRVTRLRVLIRELVASSVLRPLFMMMTPHYLNKMIPTLIKGPKPAGASSSGGNGGGGGGGGGSSGRDSDASAGGTHGGDATHAASLVEGVMEFDRRVKQSQAAEALEAAGRLQRRQQRHLKPASAQSSPPKVLSQQQQQQRPGRPLASSAHPEGPSSSSSSSLLPPTAPSSGAQRPQHPGWQAAPPPTTVAASPSRSGGPGTPRHTRSHSASQWGGEGGGGAGELLPSSRSYADFSEVACEGAGGVSFSWHAGLEHTTAQPVHSSASLSLSVGSVRNAHPMTTTGPPHAPHADGRTLAGQPPTASCHQRTASTSGPRSPTASASSFGSPGGGAGGTARYGSQSSPAPAGQAGRVMGPLASALEVQQWRTASASAGGSNGGAAAAALRTLPDNWVAGPFGAPTGGSRYGFIGYPRATVVAPELNSSASEREHVVYKIRVADDSGEWTVTRRYRHFQDLHARLRKRRLYLELSLLLPSKHIFVPNQDIKFVNKRRLELDYYLNGILRCEDLAHCQEVWHFLSSSAEGHEAGALLGLTTAVSVGSSSGGGGNGHHGGNGGTAAGRSPSSVSDRVPPAAVAAAAAAPVGPLPPQGSGSAALAHAASAAASGRASEDTLPEPTTPTRAIPVPPAVPPDTAASLVGQAVVPPLPPPPPPAGGVLRARGSSSGWLGGAEGAAAGSATPSEAGEGDALLGDMEVTAGSLTGSTAEARAEEGALSAVFSNLSNLGDRLGGNTKRLGSFLRGAMPSLPSLPSLGSPGPLTLGMPPTAAAAAAAAPPPPPPPADQHPTPPAAAAISTPSFLSGTRAALQQATMSFSLRGKADSAASPPPTRTPSAVRQRPSDTSGGGGSQAIATATATTAAAVTPAATSARPPPAPVPVTAAPIGVATREQDSVTGRTLPAAAAGQAPVPPLPPPALTTRRATRDEGQVGGRAASSTGAPPLDSSLPPKSIASSGGSLPVMTAPGTSPERRHNALPHSITLQARNTPPPAVDIGEAALPPPMLLPVALVGGVGAGVAEEDAYLESAGLSGPLYDLVDAVFHLRSRGFFRRQVMGAARQMFSMVAGDAVDLYLMNLVRALTSENSIARAIMMLQRTLWPGGVWFAWANPPPPAASAIPKPPLPPAPTPAPPAAPAPVVGPLTAAKAALTKAKAALLTAAADTGSPRISAAGAAPAVPPLPSPPPAAAPSAPPHGALEPSRYLEAGPAPVDAADVRAQALAALLSTAPPALVRLVGQRTYRQSLTEIFDMLQSPTFVLQLAYGVLDICVSALFPELHPLLSRLHQDALPQHLQHTHPTAAAGAAPSTL